MANQRHTVAYLDGLPPIGVLRDRQVTLAPHVLCAAKHAGEVNAFPLALLGDFVREPHKGVIL